MIRCTPALNYEALGTVSLMALEPFARDAHGRAALGALFALGVELGLIDNSNLTYWAQKLHQRVRTTHGT